MSSAETIFKDILEIHGRLLEHRPVLQGDINFFIREFEEKRDFRELTRLKDIQNRLQQSVDEDLPECETLLSEHSQNINSKVKKAIEKCDEIVSKEGSVETEFLRQQREDRAVEWSEFMKSQFDKSAQVDKDFQNQIEATEKHYQDLEAKLKMPHL